MFLSHLLSSPFYSLSLLQYCGCNSDPGSYSRLFSTPPRYGTYLAFLSLEDFSSFFPRRLVSNCTRYILNYYQYQVQRYVVLTQVSDRYTKAPLLAIYIRTYDSKKKYVPILLQLRCWYDTYCIMCLKTSTRYYPVALDKVATATINSWVVTCPLSAAGS